MKTWQPRPDSGARLEPHFLADQATQLWRLRLNASNGTDLDDERQQEPPPRRPGLHHALDSAREVVSMAKRTSPAGAPWRRDNPKKRAGKPSRKLTGEQKARYRGQLEAILDHVAKLQELDTTDVPPTTSASAGSSPRPTPP